MTRTRLRLFAVIALLPVAGGALGSGGADPTLQEIAGYRQWTRVNEKPLLVENSLFGGA